ncbi:MAG: 16S rRNA (uracil(1498)-N(3))-methyltransferase [Bacteroidota bacterium]
MHLFYQPQVANGVHHLSKEESQHCIRVLRKKNGDQINITDGLGWLYSANIISDNPKKCEFNLTGQTKEEQKNYSVHIGIAPTKNIDRLEWFVEKATEIGIDEITLLKTDNSERTHVKTERLEKKAISAMKQSLKYRLPIVNPIINFSEVLQIESTSKCIAHVDSDNSTLLSSQVLKGKNFILIGPEGDFSRNEVNLATKSGWRKVSLGNSRLRTETAGLIACHLVHIFN